MTSPTVLLIEDQEWTARSIESIFRPANFAVLKTYTGRQGLEVAARLNRTITVEKAVTLKAADVLKLTLS